jgi:hypothetical protein
VSIDQINERLYDLPSMDEGAMPTLTDIEPDVVGEFVKINHCTRRQARRYLGRNDWDFDLASREYREDHWGNENHDPLED